MPWLPPARPPSVPIDHLKERSHSGAAWAVMRPAAIVPGFGRLVDVFLAIPEAAMADYWRRAGVADHAAFVRAGTMHDFSYWGGGIGIITASVFLVLTWSRLVRRRRQQEMPRSFDAA